MLLNRQLILEKGKNKILSKSKRKSKSLIYSRTKMITKRMAQKLIDLYPNYELLYKPPLANII